MPIIAITDILYKFVFFEGKNSKAIAIYIFTNGINCSKRYQPLQPISWHLAIDVVIVTGINSAMSIKTKIFKDSSEKPCDVKTDKIKNKMKIPPQFTRIYSALLAFLE